MNPQRVAKLFQKVRNDTTLRRICELAGRYRRVAQAKQRMRVTHGMDEVVGVELDGDVSRLVPSELAMLADEEFEMDAMRRLVERQSMCRQFRGVEPVGKGPIIICVDESSSMSGEPICNAKAFALAMAWIAKHQNRECLLVSYSGCNQQMNTWVGLGQEKLIEWLAHFFGGGTDMDVPFLVVPKMTETANDLKEKVDMIVISDAACIVPEGMANYFNSWKAKWKVRCIGIVIGEHDTRELGKCCDEIHKVNALSVESDAVQKCLSI